MFSPARVRAALAAVTLLSVAATPVATASVATTTSVTTDPAVIAATPLPAADPVVVATFDTGTNPWHPCFRRDEVDGPTHLPPSYPSDEAVEVELAFDDTYEASRTASATALSTLRPATLHRLVGTNLSFYTADPDGLGLVDDTTHGAKASSQIGCREFGLGANAHVVVVNFFDLDSEARDAQFEWVASQPWIDVVHVNIANFVPIPFTDAIGGLIASGKLVVVAGGNGAGNGLVAVPTELDGWPGRPGLLAAGANDNGGWTSFSNYNPHVVMDGNRTLAAAGRGFGHVFFAGTSSASPRTAGYAARVLGALRAEFGHTGDGLVTVPPGARPATGPLADGELTAAELHDAIRATANPNPHDSVYDGEFGLGFGVPVPADTPAAVYAKMGYGEVSEHTIDATIDLLAGRIARPDRTVEDAFYAVSEAQRQAIWNR